MYITPVGSAALVGAGNAALTSTFNKQPLNVQQIALAAGTSAVFAWGGQLAGNALGPVFGKLFQLKSPVLQQGLAGGSLGGVVGAAGGAINAIANGENVGQGALSGFAWGASIGAATGVLSGYIVARKTNVDPWSGESNVMSEVSEKRIPKDYLPELELRGQQSIKEQAIEISRSIGKNTLPVQTSEKTLLYDLQGPDHRGVPTPHIQRKLPNINPEGEVFWNKDNKWVVPMNQGDIRIIRNVLRRR